SFLITFAFQALAHRFPIAPDRFPLLANATLAGLLVEAVALQLTEDAFALHLLLEYTNRLTDVVILDEDAHYLFRLSGGRRTPLPIPSLFASAASPSPRAGRAPRGIAMGRAERDERPQAPVRAPGKIGLRRR